MANNAAARTIVSTVKGDAVQAVAAVLPDGKIGKTIAPARKGWRHREAVPLVTLPRING